MAKQSDKDEIFKAFARELVKIATTREHDRLEAHLKQIANDVGFKTKVKFADKTRPDVLRTKGPDRGTLLIADAKVIPHDVPDNATTSAQIAGYIASFAKEPRYTSAILAIATNDKNSAKDWGVALAKWVRQAGLRPSKFEIHFTPSDIWTVIGGVYR
jgi:hypothetical protein